MRPIAFKLCFVKWAAVAAARTQFTIVASHIRAIAILVLWNDANATDPAHCDFGHLRPNLGVQEATSTILLRNGLAIDLGPSEASWRSPMRGISDP